MNALGTAGALAAIRDLRPQTYGNARTDKVHDPVIEPLWGGARVLAAVDTVGGQTPATALTEDGEELEGWERLRAAVADATRADGAVIDGYLVKPTFYDETASDLGKVELPKPGDVTKLLVIGRRRNRRAELAEQDRLEQMARAASDDERVTFVAVDLLWLDGQSLLDVPLLERKRLLETVLVEGEFVRRGAYVRAPIQTWVGSWRAQGFFGLVFKAANGRYRPGGVKDDWVRISMPSR